MVGDRLFSVYENIGNNRCRYRRVLYTRVCRFISYMFYQHASTVSAYYRHVLTSPDRWPHQWLTIDTHQECSSVVVLQHTRLTGCVCGEVVDMWLFYIVVGLALGKGCEHKSPSSSTRKTSSEFNRLGISVSTTSMMEPLRQCIVTQLTRKTQLFSLSCSTSLRP